MTTPLNAFRSATEFFAAAIAADEAYGDDKLTVPLPCLVGHAIELGLQAYLLAHGGSTYQAHNLEAVFAAAESAGLRRLFYMTAEERAFIASVNAVYTDGQFAHVGSHIYPEFHPLENLVRRLLLAVSTEIPGSETILTGKVGKALRNFLVI